MTTTVREAGWLYLVATHVGDPVPVRASSPCCMAASGSFALAPLNQATLPPGTATAIFVLAAGGFRLQSRHHAAARLAAQCPCGCAEPRVGLHVGRPHQDGHLRAGAGDVPAGDPPLEWGVVLLGLGVVSGVLGVAFAIGQHDLKRLLAYHSIENIGIIVMGLGPGLDRPFAGPRRIGSSSAWAAACCTSGTTPCSRPCCSSAPAPSSTPPTPARSTTWAAWRSRCRGRPCVFWSGRSPSAACRR